MWELTTVEHQDRMEQLHYLTTVIDDAEGMHFTIDW